MSVILRRSDDLAGVDGGTAWTGFPGTPAPNRDPAHRARDEAVLLQQAFQRAIARWRALARALDGLPGQFLSHVPSVAPNPSDFGLMLAWSQLVRDWAAAAAPTLVVCDDPWMFRHFAALPGVVAGRPPALIVPTLRLALRGVAARAAAAFKVAAAALSLRGQRAIARPRAPALLVYGHPASNAQGRDAYFGALMGECPDLGRALHVDCGAAFARLLAADGRSFSLHAFGNPLFALTLPFRRWSAPAAVKTADIAWLLRRAEAKEGAGGTAAMIRWQMHCQQRWLKARRPAVVAWPWENHGWERALVRQARALGVRSLGHQHSVIGGQANISAQGLADPQTGLPDLVVANGPSGLAQLRDSAIPEQRLHLGGTWRFAAAAAVRHDPAGPVFLALPFDRVVAAQMIAAAGQATAQGFRFLAKDHPLHPVDFADQPGLTRTQVGLTDQPGLRAVVFAATAVGLEAVLSGLPTVRFLPRGCYSLDILPKEISVPTADSERLGAVLASVEPQAAIAWEEIFSRPDPAVWRSFLRVT